MLKNSAILLSITLLSGCGTTVQILGAWYDHRDPCQSKGRVNYQYPDFCGAGTASSGAVIRAKDGRILGTVK